MSLTLQADTASEAVGGADRIMGRDVTAPIPEDFRLESGEALPETQVRGRLYGRPGAPLVVVAGGISSGRHVADDAPDRKAWWSKVARPGGSLDLDRFQVLGIDYAPGALDVPLTITTHDQARLIELLLDRLGQGHVHALIGGSYGGMIGLALAERSPERLERLIAVSAADRAHPMATAWRGVQRRILRFAREKGDVAGGVALARELAMTTYRTPGEFAERFDGPVSAAAGEPYAVCDYLMARGRAYPAVMDDRRWITLSDSIDRHRVDPAAISTPTTLVGFDTDRLVPIEDIRRLAEGLPNLRSFEARSSAHGHDSFLTEFGLLAPILEGALSAPV